MERDEFGRSMIEMLGVLAIVGILSIGAISGFQKAMFKYKLQKTTEEYNMLFQDVLKYHKEFIALSSQIAPLLHDMGLVPATWRQGGGLIYDRLNNKINPFIRSHKYVNFDIHLKADDTSIFVCEAIYRDVFMQFSDTLFNVSISRRDSEDVSSGGEYTRYGNLYCNGITKKCVKDMTLSDIRNSCSVCAENDNYCVIFINL
ncbi:MAG: type II secretion system protein [Alphaproteobacteria bacterium]|nr:type II secretion system protein [Alphaproteobacteria bacterium]